LFAAFLALTGVIQFFLCSDSVLTDNQLLHTVIQRFDSSRVSFLSVAVSLAAFFSGIYGAIEKLSPEYKGIKRTAIRKTHWFTIDLVHITITWGMVSVLLFALIAGLNFLFVSIFIVSTIRIIIGFVSYAVFTRTTVIDRQLRNKIKQMIECTPNNVCKFVNDNAELLLELLKTENKEFSYTNALQRYANRMDKQVVGLFIFAGWCYHECFRETASKASYKSYIGVTDNLVKHRWSYFKPTIPLDAINPYKRLVARNSGLNRQIAFRKMRAVGDSFHYLTSNNEDRLQQGYVLSGKITYALLSKEKGYDI